MVIFHSYVSLPEGNGLPAIMIIMFTQRKNLIRVRVVLWSHRDTFAEGAIRLHLNVSKLVLGYFFCVTK
jgi:hypothetical protein